METARASLREYSAFIEGGSSAESQNYLGELKNTLVFLGLFGAWQVVSKGASGSCAAVVSWVWSAVQDDTDLLLEPSPSCSAVTPLPILSKHGELALGRGHTWSVDSAQKVVANQGPYFGELWVVSSSSIELNI